MTHQENYDQLKEAINNDKIFQKHWVKHTQQLLAAIQSLLGIYPAPAVLFKNPFTIKRNILGQPRQVSAIEWNGEVYMVKSAYEGEPAGYEPLNDYDMVLLVRIYRNLITGSLMLPDGSDFGMTFGDFQCSKYVSPYLSDDMYLPISYKGHVVNQPNYKGKGEHSVAELEAIIEQYKEYCHQQQLIKQNCQQHLAELKG